MSVSVSVCMCVCMCVCVCVGVVNNVKFKVSQSVLHRFQNLLQRKVEMDLDVQHAVAALAYVARCCVSVRTNNRGAI